MIAFVPSVRFVVSGLQSLNVFDLRAAFLAEFRLAFEFRAAGFAVQFGVHRLATFRAELAVGNRAAICARSADNRGGVFRIHDRVDGLTTGRGMNCSGAHINLRSVIGLLRAFVKLLTRGARFCLGVTGGKFLFVIRRAAFAQTRARVPTDFRADPTTAARALMKMLFGFFDGDGKSVIVGLAANGALDVVSAIARAG